METFQPDPLLKRQEELEAISLGEGATRFRQRLNDAIRSGRGGEVGAARTLLHEGLEPMIDGLNELLEVAKKSRGARHVALPWIERVGVETTAYMTLRTCLGALASTEIGYIRHISKGIVSSMLDELRYRRFQEQAPGLFRYRMRLLDTANYAHARKAIDATMRFAKIDVDDLEIGQRETLLIGGKLIDVFVECTGLARVESGMEKGRKDSRPTGTLTLVAEEKATEWMMQKNARLELLFPVHLPMVVPPLPWLPDSPGGYAFGLRGKHSLMRMVTETSVNEKADLPVVRAALNSIQATPWRINLPVMALIAKMAEANSIPGEVVAELPPKPDDINTNEHARRKWRKTAAAIKNANHTKQQKALLTLRMLDVAGIMANETFYFPYNLDFRGRVYPIPNFLSPHGDDKQKSLLLFDEKVVLGKAGLRYLALHGANCLDVTPQGTKMSTLTLDERVEWITRNSGKIKQVAEAPLEHTWWLDADQPFCFYAFALEWTRIHSVRGKKPWECKSNLPVSQDGSCNGVQHFSALLRDPIGGAAVNLVPSPRPNDLYQAVSSDCLHALESLSAGGEGDRRLASLWLASGVVTRSFCKRPAMTFGYGSQEFGFASQIVEYCKGLPEWESLQARFRYEDANGKTREGMQDAAAFMATVIWDALRTRVVAAFSAMEWMRACTKKLSKYNLPVEWSVPGTDLYVRQTYFKEKTHQIRTVIGGKLRRPAYYSKSSRVQSEKQANAVSPNFIHSLDAAVMMFTVNAAVERGITHFALVHDSFATHAGRMEEFSKVIREAFVRFYEEHDPIAALHGEFAVRLAQHERVQGLEPVTLPEPPAKGSLDIRVVLDSPYFFQ